jgi:ankyrin repeat protein
MTRADATFGPLVRAIIADDRSAVSHLLETSPEMARARLESGATRAQAADYFVDELGHYLYAGDTPLHVTAVAYRAWLVPILVAAGAEVAAGNRRGAQPLHYAADGGPGSRRWAPATQRDTVLRLIAAGADPNAVDLGGVTPLHRAVRNRCADAVSALLEGGADPGRPNKRGSTPMQLALTASGRGGSGSDIAKAQQAEIVRLLKATGVTR